MRLKSFKVKNFRRFTDLTVRGIPETARLIILVGPNGCGKSSFFDALIAWRSSKHGHMLEEDYHDKHYEKGNSINTDRLGLSRFDIDFFDLQSNRSKKSVYARSAYRNETEYQMRELSRLEDPLGNFRMKRMIDNDAAIAQNFQRLVSQSIEGLYEPKDGSMTLEDYKEEMFGSIRDALGDLFPDLTFDNLGNPLKDGTFRFTKGTSKGFPLKNLSGGEKAAFDLILDLIVARHSYDDTLYCIDEPESHLHTRLQAKLLSVLYNLIPDNCQLLLATHSIGMMREAWDIERQNSGKVVFLDFGNRNFDKEQIIEPRNPDRKFWREVYDTALGDLANHVAPERVIICEGHPVTKRPVSNYWHDAKCYERIFENEFPETKFVSMGNDREVSSDRYGAAEMLQSLMGGLEVMRLIDRDDRSDEEIAELQKEGVRVLSWRNLEFYLFHNEVLRALAEAENQPDKVNKLLARKREILKSNSCISSDDLKRANGKIYLACKEILNLTQHGNNKNSFARDTLAPLIKPGMKVYKQLKRDIFGSAEEDGDVQSPSQKEND